MMQQSVGVGVKYSEKAETTSSIQPVIVLLVSRAQNKPPSNLKKKTLLHPPVKSDSFTGGTD